MCWKLHGLTPGQYETELIIFFLWNCLVHMIPSGTHPFKTVESRHKHMQDPVHCQVHVHGPSSDVTADMCSCQISWFWHRRGQKTLLLLDVMN